jgi:hypothetical protein
MQCEIVQCEFNVDGICLLSHRDLSIPSNVENVETPVGATAETPVGATAETPVGATAETPVGATAETPVGATAETPVGATAETPIRATAETPIRATAETPGLSQSQKPIAFRLCQHHESLLLPYIKKYRFLEKQVAENVLLSHPLETLALAIQYRKHLYAFIRYNAPCKPLYLNRIMELDQLLQPIFIRCEIRSYKTLIRHCDFIHCNLLGYISIKPWKDKTYQNHTINHLVFCPIHAKKCARIYYAYKASEEILQMSKMEFLQLDDIQISKDELFEIQMHTSVLAQILADRSYLQSLLHSKKLQGNAFAIARELHFNRQQYLLRLKEQKNAKEAKKKLWR